MSFSRSGSRSRVARSASWLAVLSLVTMALLAPAGVSAHTPKVSLTCEDGLVVDLADYKAGPNTVSISIDGTAVAGSPFSFSTDYSATFVVAPPTVAHTATVVIFVGRSHWQQRLLEDVQPQRGRVRRAHTYTVTGSADSDARASAADAHAGPADPDADGRCRWRDGNTDGTGRWSRRGDWNTRQHASAHQLDRPRHDIDR